MSDRRAVIEWRTGQLAELTVAGGWRVDPHDPTLAALLNSEHSLARAQARRATALPRDLLLFTARRAAVALGAEVVQYDPPQLERTR